VTPAQAIEQAKTGKLLPMYVVTGDEGFLRDQVVAELRAASLAGGVAAFNEDKYTAGEVNADKVIAAARTVPMMAARRFVLVRGAEKWDGASDGERESPLDRLALYAAEPIDSTCLVVSATKLDGRRKLSALAKKHGFLVLCETLDARALPGWILDRVKAKGHPMDRDVAELLAEIAGPELSYVNDAIERLSLYAGVSAEGKPLPITEDAVSECVARVRTADTWALVDAVGARDLARALRLLADVYDPRDHGLPLLGAVAWSIRQLAKFQAALAGGATQDEASRRAGASPMRTRELAAKARVIRAKEVERWILVLAETDLALKSSRRPADAILEDMLTRLCRK
jgi:DNA polymerase-3 subunit delta